MIKMIKSTNRNISTMTSRDIADIVEKRHDVVKLSIERLVDKGVISEPPLVDGIKSANGVIEKIYLLKKRDTYIVVAQLSPEFTARLVDRWQELEDKAQQKALRSQRMPSINSVGRFCFGLARELLATVPGLKPEMAAAYALNQIEVSTGQDVTHLMKALPAVIPEEQANLNATDIGKRMSISSRDVNLELANLKLLVRNNKDQWELTESGTAYGEAKPYHKNGHSGYQILWKESVIDLLINQRNLLKH